MKKSSSSSRGSKKVIRKKTSRKPASKAISLQSSKTLTKPAAYPRSAGDAFVTQKMLYSVRDELIAHTEGRFHEVKADLAKLDKSVHRVALLVEEQNNRNKIVLDGLTQLFARQDRIEKKLDSSL